MAGGIRSAYENAGQLGSDRWVSMIGLARHTDEAAMLASFGTATTLDTLLRLFAPFLPFATEEVWSWWRKGSVHRVQWPAPLDVPGGDTSMLATVGVALSGVRKAKSEAKVKQRTEVLTATITAPEALTAQLQAGLADLKAASNAREIILVVGEGELSVSDVALAATEEPAKA